MADITDPTSMSQRDASEFVLSLSFLPSFEIDDDDDDDGDRSTGTGIKS